MQRASPHQGCAPRSCFVRGMHQLRAAAARLQVSNRGPGSLRLHRTRLGAPTSTNESRQHRLREPAAGAEGRCRPATATLSSPCRSGAGTRPRRRLAPPLKPKATPQNTNLGASLGRQIPPRCSAGGSTGGLYPRTPAPTHTDSPSSLLLSLSQFLELHAERQAEGSKGTSVTPGSGTPRSTWPPSPSQRACKGRPSLALGLRLSTRPAGHASGF